MHVQVELVEYIPNRLVDAAGRGDLKGGSHRRLSPDGDEAIVGVAGQIECSGRCDWQHGGQPGPVPGTRAAGGIYLPVTNRGVKSTAEAGWRGGPKMAPPRRSFR